MKNLITQDPKILGGKPIIAGTRMSVEVVLEFLAGGMEIKEILKECPFLNMEQIKAAIQYAASKVSHRKDALLSLEHSKSQVTLHEIRRGR